MFIEILSPELERENTVKRFSSFQYTERFYDIGSFELHVPAEYGSFFEKNKIIKIGYMYGIVLYRETDGIDCKICGYTLDGMTKWRVYNKADLTANAESVMKSIVDQTMVNAVDTSRNISNMTIEADGHSGELTTWQPTVYVVSDELAKIGLYHEIGFDIVPKLNEETLKYDFMFRTRIGTDRTVNQSVLPPVIFSQKRKNISGYSYTNDILTACNVVYFGAEDYSLHEDEGFLRREAYQEAYEDLEEQTWKQFLSENGEIETISAVANSRTVYGVDWNLGDYVTVRIFAFGEQLERDLQITEVKRTFEPNRITVEPTFGTSTKSIIRRRSNGI